VVCEGNEYIETQKYSSENNAYFPPPQENYPETENYLTTQPINYLKKDENYIKPQDKTLNQGHDPDGSTQGNNEIDHDGVTYYQFFTNPQDKSPYFYHKIYFNPYLKYPNPRKYMPHGNIPGYLPPPKYWIPPGYMPPPVYNPSSYTPPSYVSPTYAPPSYGNPSYAAPPSYMPPINTPPYNAPPSYTPPTGYMPQINSYMQVIMSF
jgi:hypothetical protein